MSTDVYPRDDNWKEVFHRMCICGHELYLHAHVLAYNYQTGQQHLRVSQCIYVDECECKEFQQKDPS